MAAGVDPAEVVEHPPIDVTQVGNAKILAPCFGKDLLQLCGGNRLQNAVSSLDVDSLPCYQAIAIRG